MLCWVRDAIEDAPQTTSRLQKPQSQEQALAELRNHPWKRDRALQIIKYAKEKGVTNALLIAGIANNETGMAQCVNSAGKGEYSRGTACVTNYNASECFNGGTKVIAGAGDGSCNAGGLSMFQFDAGTWNQTVDTYGTGIFGVRGAVHAAIDYIHNRITGPYMGANSMADTITILNRIRVGTPEYDRWIVAHRRGYNPGAGSAYEAQTKVNTEALLWAYGNDFWYPKPVDPSAPIGYIDSVSASGLVTGWACDRDRPNESIGVHVYVGGPAGAEGAKGYATIVANRGSEVGVNKACGGGKAHRFSFQIPESSCAKEVYAYGINVAGTKGGNGMLKNSGTQIACFGEWAPIGYIDGMDANGNVTGWACDPDWPDASISVHVYAGGPAGKGKGFPVTANLASEAGVNSRCKGGKAHRFKAAVGTQYRGKPIYAYGLNLAWTNGWTMPLTNSGKTF
ncbi:MAG: hypothetical protein R3A47_04245 [Polyangiales bacterium]